MLIWPLSASIFVIALCWLAMQADPTSRRLTAKALELWQATYQSSTAGRAVPPSGEDDFAALGQAPDGTTAAANRSPARRSRDADAWDELAEIESWSDTSFELTQPVIAGIPAPSLDKQSDLFGFEVFLGDPDQRSDVPPSRREGEPVLSLTPTAEQGVDVDWSVTGKQSENGLVIRIDPDLFFSNDQPLSLGTPQNRPEAGSPRLAERPSDDPALPSIYEAPEPVVADLSPGIVSPGRSESISRESDADLLKLERDDFAPRSASQSTYGDPSTVPAQPPMPAQPPVPANPRHDADASDEPGGSSRLLTEARSATWPVTPQLLEQLSILERIAESTRVADRVDQNTPSITADDLIQWSSSVRSVLRRLPMAKRLGEAGVEQSLEELKTLQTVALIQAESLRSRSRRVAWLQAAYSIQRRLSVWEPIFRINSGDFPAPQHVGDDVISVSIAIDRLESRLPETGDTAGWTRFLMLEELRSVFESGDDQARRELSQKFLARLSWPNLAPPHRRFLAADVVNDVAQVVRPWASDAMDYSALMHQIEKAESNAIDLVTAEVARSMQALQHADHEQAKQLATNLDTHYRNANVRFSLSEELLQSLLPDVPPRDVPVRTTLLGSRVTGISRVTSDLEIKLTPSPSTWELTLEAIGNVSTGSIGRRGPAAVRTSSVNPFSASTPISIKPTDIELGSASVNVGGRSRLRGINTTYDGWPLIGALVKDFAETEYFAQAPLANRIGRSRIGTQLGEEFERTIDQKVESATARFSKSILGPLTDLQLQPQVIDMSSTASRLIARYRMAGDWQLAAMTPRPRALANNLFSVQLHQSAINNTLEQLVPQDDAMPIQDVLQQCFDLLGLNTVEVPEDLPQDTLIQFARHRPITVEIESGRVWITMRIIRLQSGSRLRLRNFIVRASYKPEVDGLNASLVREGHLSISGPGMSMRQRLPVRAIFNKVLSPNRGIELTSPDLLAERLPEQSGITQFELRDGWIGISVGEMAENQQVASRPHGIR